MNHLLILEVHPEVFQLLVRLVQQVVVEVVEFVLQMLVALEDRLVQQEQVVLQNQVVQEILHQQLPLKVIMQEQLTIIQVMHKEAVAVLLQSE